MAAGACVGVALLLGRGEATTPLVVIPLVAWLFAATRVPTSTRAAAIQIAVIVGVAIPASGHLGVGPLSFWDAVLAYDVLAVTAYVAAWYADQRPHLDGRFPRPTVLRRRLAQAEHFGVPVATVAACCLGTAVTLPVVPPRPPSEIVYPLPADVWPTSVDVLCGPGPSVTCTWSIDVEGEEDLFADVIAGLEDHLTRTKGWNPTSQCRSWGWVLKERACVTVELRGAELPFTIIGTARVSIVVTYG
jgi:hypothetical protein